MSVIEDWDADQELTVSQAKQCLAWLEHRAMQIYLDRSRVVSDAVREYMVDNHSGVSTTRVDFEEAVRRIAYQKYAS